MAIRLVIDDRSSNTLLATSGASWRAVTDTVMGGNSDGHLLPTEVEGRNCLHLMGSVSLENNGGFVQASLDLIDSNVVTPELFDASSYTGIEIEVLGNGEEYNLHLRTDDTRIVWQSYRASFKAPPHWQTIRLPFDGFQPYRVDKPIDTRKLKRLGIVAIGRVMKADVCISRLSLYQR